MPSLAEVAEILGTLVRLAHFRVENHAIVSAALQRYAASHLDFGDAMILAAMGERGSHILYSYDADFDRDPALTRREP